MWSEATFIEWCNFLAQTMDPTQRDAQKSWSKAQLWYLGQGTFLAP